MHMDALKEDTFFSCHKLSLSVQISYTLDFAFMQFQVHYAQMSCHVITEAQACESWRVCQEELPNPLNRFPWPSHLVALKCSQLPCSASPSPKYPMTWR